MATAKDIILDDSADLVILNGDFSVKESDQQHSVLLINTNQGAWKQFSLCGFGIRKYIGASGVSQIMRRGMTVQHEADGFKVNDIVVKNTDDFFIDVERIENGD